MKGQVTIATLFGTFVLLLISVSVAPVFYYGINLGWDSLNVAQKFLAMLIVPFLFYAILVRPFIKHDEIGNMRRFQ